MPRRMGEITERLPAPQYDQPTALKRTRSQPSSQLEVIDDNNLASKVQSASKPGTRNHETSQTPKQTASL